MRRLFIALVVVAALAGSAFGQEQTRTTKKELQSIQQAAPVLPVTLTALFTIAAETTLADGTWIPAEVPNIMVARKNADGTLSTACVTSEENARTFMRQRQQREEPAKPAEK